MNIHIIITAKKKDYFNAPSSVDVHSMVEIIKISPSALIIANYLIALINVRLKVS